jgi:hypothetical protein
MKRHYERYGWVNFLKTIASTKVFDIPSSGMNSIECVKQARAFDVLIFASEDKAFNEAEALDFEEQERRRK